IYVQVDGYADFIDLFSASDANNPNWVYVGTGRPFPFYGSYQVVSLPFTLGSGELQAVRAVYGYSQDHVPCRDNGPFYAYYNFEDRDDLVFKTSSDTTPPTINIVSPGYGQTMTDVISIKGTADDNVKVEKVEVQVDFGEWHL